MGREPLPVYESQAERFGLGPASLLFLCLGMDAVGMLSYLIPVAGEAFDIAWAPLNAAFIWWMLSDDPRAPWFVGFGFLEEIFPFTDILPSCTIAWLHRYAGVP